MEATGITLAMEVAVTAAAISVAMCAPVMAISIGRRLGLQTRLLLMSEISAAARVGSGVAYQALAASSGKPASIELRDAALAAGVQHVMQTAPVALTAFGFAEAEVEAMVVGELGRLLAVDPAVPAGPSASAARPA